MFKKENSPISLNIRRRHPSLKQKEELLRKLRNTVWPKMGQGAPTKGTNGPFIPTNAKVAKALGVSKRTVKRWDAKREGRVREPDPEPEPEPEPEAPAVKWVDRWGFGACPSSSFAHGGLVQPHGRIRRVGWRVA